MAFQNVNVAEGSQHLQHAWSVDVHTSLTAAQLAQCAISYDVIACTE